MIVHKGEIIEKAVRERRFPITLLAKRLKKSRRYVYDIFEKQDVPLDLILKIGKIIQHDFSNELKNLSKIPKEYQIEVMTEPDIAFEDVNYWKSKYFELLSQYKQLLESKLEDYFKKE